MLDKVKEGVLFMKTHELEKELGISKHTIFYYEKEGIVTPHMKKKESLHHKEMIMVIVVIAKMIYKNSSW